LLAVSFLSQIPPVLISKDMSIGHADFWRLFLKIDAPVISDQVSCQAGMRRCQFDWQGGSITVELSAESIRQIAALVLPQTDVALHYIGLSQMQIDEFEKKFERQFQRAGG
jgi:hypothetical protein